MTSLPTPSPGITAIFMALLLAAESRGTAVRRVRPGRANSAARTAADDIGPRREKEGGAPHGPPPPTPTGTTFTAGSAARALLRHDDRPVCGLGLFQQALG